MDMKKQIVYHATKEQFDNFDLNYCGSIKEHATNSKLGFFFATPVEHNDNQPPEFIENFGHHIIKAELNISSNYIMTISEFVKIQREYDDSDDSVNYWINIRKEFLNQGYKTIGLKERSKEIAGRDDMIGMYIVLDTNAILEHEYINQNCFKP